uniref:Secreted protein n=1 Tax=Loa loa TaxID=7209 RepID=A0A1I7VYN1_LOALO
MGSRRGGYCLLAAFCHSLLLLTCGWLIRCYLSSSTLSSPSRRRHSNLMGFRPVLLPLRFHRSSAHMFVCPYRLS